MTKRFRELSNEEKSEHRVTGDTGDTALLYCTACDRTMEQGDCSVPEDIEIKLRCAYDDCVMEDNIALQRLYGWDDYRMEYEEETAEWPDTPVPGECYTPKGDAP